MPEIVERRGRDPLRRVFFVLFITILVSLCLLGQLTGGRWWVWILVAIICVVLVGTVLRIMNPKHKRLQ